MGGLRKVTKIKEGLRSLMSEIKYSRFHEGLITNGLFTFKNKMSSNAKDKNHLFDNIDEDNITHKK